MITNTNPAEGMRDLNPKEVELRNYVTRIITESYKKFGFVQIDTPCVEKINLLTSGDGGENEKMLFKILKRGDKLNFENPNDIVDLGLRYDLTVPLCRFYANNRTKLPQHFKVIQVGSVWRAERPQKGRFRQFTQCDIDIIGIPDVIAEIQLILATAAALQNLSFTNFTVRINDRRILEALATHCDFEETSFSKVFIILDKLDKIGIDGVQNELYKAELSPSSIEKFIGIVKSAIDSGITINSITTVLPNIPEKVLADLNKVIETVSSQSQNNYSIALDISLVRGMGYYTGQIFEIGIEGFNSSIAGGGRYDKMIGKILNGKEEIPACGFSIGFERVLTILEEKQFAVPILQKKIVVLYSEDIVTFNDLLTKAQKLREEGNVVSLEVQNKKN
ncbi:MAG TPA: histidine--tRNA ligase, partial [Chitinophagales bacterium]|nr:histidine--tRNA ligase [Chitinophagales bacterium]